MSNPMMATQQACWNEEDLLNAVLKGNLERVRSLLENGTDVNATDEYFRTSPLHIACGHGHEAVVALLLQRGAEVNAKNSVSEVESPLHLACRGGHYAVVAMLLKNGADWNASNTNGETPLHLACRGGYHEVVLLLLEYGAEVNCTTSQG